jgi:RND superfamily putative drug exporter
MLGLMVASITTMIQVGFVIGVGILLDTFVVRTITVPAMAAIVGRANWWPYRWLPARRPSKVAATRHRHRRTKDSVPGDSDDAITDVIPTDLRFT